jgi:ATP-dependent helicase IRC3
MENDQVIIESPKLKWEKDGRENIPTQGKRRELKPYPYQGETWKKMDFHFLQQNRQTGIIWVPTGGGKTVIAVKWLYENVLAKGMRVLWITHRLHLLKQAAETFNSIFDNKFLPEEKKEEGIHIALVAGTAPGTRWKSIAERDSVVFSTIQTAYSDENIPSVELMLQQSPKGLYVVVDECHHAQAPSYLKVLHVLKQGGAKIIGLSATPYSMDDKKTNLLWNFFDSPDKNPVSRVYKQFLIENHFLAHPKVETIPTKIEQREITGDDQNITKNKTKDSELKQYVLKRLGNNPARNKLIAQRYKDNQEEYGKTIIFTPETLANKKLVEELKKLEVEADYVDTYRSSEDNQKVMERFRTDPTLKVLVNTEICLEGYDAPKTKTVMIARPTLSQTLVQQMVGRAMRGELAGGNKECNLVTFVDTWKDFTPLDPQLVVNEEDNEDSKSVDEIVKTKNVAGELIPQSIIDECYLLLQSIQLGSILGTFAAIPYGWYEWDTPENTEREPENSGTRMGERFSEKRQIPIFDVQSEGYEQLVTDIRENKLQIPKDLSDAFVENVRHAYFEVCPDPVPQLLDLKDLLTAWRDAGGVDGVTRITFKEREKFNTKNIALEILKNDLRESEKQKLIDDHWSDPICQRCYKLRLKFVEDIDYHKNNLDEKNKKDNDSKSLRDKKQIPKKTLEKWKEGEVGYELRKILNDVGSNNKLFPSGIPSVKDVSYNDKLLSKNALAQCNMSDGNKILVLDKFNSPSVPLLILEFLMYHELIHALGYYKHDGAFKEIERKFIPSKEAQEDANKYSEWKGSLGQQKILWQAICDQFLDNFLIDYNIQSKDELSNGEY